MNDYTQLPLPFPPETIEIELSKKGSKAGLFKAIVNADDADLEQFNWTVLTNKSLAYAYRKIRQPDGTQKIEFMHRVILSRMLNRTLARSDYVDHIDNDGLNNTRQNLRRVTQAENMRNTRLRDNNTSGYKGISLDKKSGLWHAYIHLYGKRKNLGYFQDIKDAIAERSRAEQKYHGEYARKKAM